jgi:hypothetical protein
LEQGLILPSHLVLPPHLEQLIGWDNSTLRWLAAGIFADSITAGVDDAGSGAHNLSRAVFQAAFDLHPEKQQQVQQHQERQQQQQPQPQQQQPQQQQQQQQQQLQPQQQQ